MSRACGIVVLFVAGTVVAHASATPRSVTFDEIRRWFPADGKVITVVTKKDHWKNNSQPFERHQTFEIALGKKIRAKRSSQPRMKKPSMERGVDHVLLRGGWRAHIDVPKRGDYFDGVFEAKLGLIRTDGTVRVRVYDVETVWNKGFGDGIYGIGDRIEDLVATKLKDYGERALNKHVTSLGIDSDRFDVGIRNGDIVVTELQQSVRYERFNLSASPIKYRPPHTAGKDREFGGNGPRVIINASLRADGNNVLLELSMDATETKSNHTACRGSVEKIVHEAARPIKRIVGASEWKPLVKYTDSNHKTDVHHTVLGPIDVYGDRDGKDCQDYTGFRTDFDYEVTVELD